MKFKKIYIEITNSCNFSCSFCYKSKRTKRTLSVEEFRFICEKIQPFTKYIYLHVMGEPLLHPHFREIMQTATAFGFNTNITTNASLIEKQRAVLNDFSPHQINISLHDLEEQVDLNQLSVYLDRILSITNDLAATTYFNLRLWNRIEGKLNSFSDACLKHLSEKLDIDSSIFTPENIKKGIHLRKHIYLQTADRFDWPNEKALPSNKPKTCYALKDHIAILSDGSVVPCCIDADAHLLLGNIFTDELETMVKSQRALRIKNGFARKEAVEEFCKGCGFR